MGSFDLEGKRIWVAGHGGMVGAALVSRLQRENCEILTVSRAELDLRDPFATLDWMSAKTPHAVIIAAAKVGGILANDSLPVEFLRDNILIETNLIEASHRIGVEKLLFLGSSCIYPKFAEQPIAEEALLTGPLEPTNEWYAIAKIAGIKLAQAYRKQYGRNFISAMPTNLYGPGDNFDLLYGHVLPALLRKAHEAKQRGDHEIVVWGTGTPRREFLHVDDCADALIFLLKNYSDPGHINVGSGSDISIGDLTRLVCEVIGFDGKIVFDRNKPDGTPRKLLNSDKLLTMGWMPRIDLASGIRSTYEWFLQNRAD